jgi:hypothetical protein
MELSPFLATETMAWEDSETGLTRMKSYRAHARKLLREKVNMEEAKKCLNSDLSPEIYNGLFACIAISRHAYRYAFHNSATTSSNYQLGGQQSL